MVQLNLIFTSLRREPRLFGLWVLCLSLAVTGLLVVDVFRHSLSETLRVQGRKILSSDLALSARRPFTADERLKIAALVPTSPAQASEVTELLAMMSHKRDGKDEARLATVRFVDNAYPLAGDLWIEPEPEATAEPPHQGQGAELGTEPTAWLATDLATLLHLNLGDQVRIGKVDFRVAGWIRKDSNQTFRFGSMAPRVYVHSRHLTESGLIQYGSTFSQTLYLNLPPGSDQGLKSAFEKTFEDPSIQVTIPTDLEQGSFRVLSRLLDFLGLTGLVTLCLGWTGVYYLGRRWLSLETLNVGVLKCLGLASREVRHILLGKLFVILASGILTGGVLAWALAHLVLPQVKSAMPSEFTLVWSWTSTLLLLLVGPVSGVLLLYPALGALADEQALALVQGRNEPRVSLVDFLAFAATTFALFFVITLAQAKSWKVSFIFLGALMGTVLAIGALSYAILGRAARQSHRRGWRVHLTLSLWSRRRAMGVLMITVSAIAGLLSQLVPHLEKTLVGELQAPTGIDRPALFLFDIQDEQLTDLQSLLTREKIEVSENAPFIRARILSVNGKEFERTQTGKWSTREDEMDARFRNRGVNLTYRTHLAAGDQILKGKPWEQINADPEHLEISVEQGYADRLGLKLGDQLRFDVQGIELTATIGNLREVDWNRFEPNFFITFKPGALEEAPKTWVMTLRRHPQLSPVEMQAKISTQLPNVTSINVKEALDNASELFGKLSSGLKLASALCLGLGVFVFLMILMFQLSSSARDWQQLRVLGLSPRELLGLQLLSYGGLALVGLSLGSAMALLVAWALSHFAFQTRLQADWLTSLQILFVSLLLSIVGVTLLARRLNRNASLQSLIGGD